MTLAQLSRAWPLVACALALVTALAGVWGGGRVAAGVLAGGAWSAANLTCLVLLLNAGLGPRRSLGRVAGWLILKFPLLYLAAYGLLQYAGLSQGGFGLGFTQTN